MTDTDAADRRVAARLQDWIEGRRPCGSTAGTLDVLIGADADPHAVGELAARGVVDVVFAPRGAAVDHERLVHYDGDFGTTGVELGIADDLVIQLESYSTAPYVSPAAPTAISIVDEADLRSLSADAERAIAEGEFPRHLLGPYVTFLDLASWLAPEAPSLPPSRLWYVEGDAWRSGPTGERVDVARGLGQASRALSPAASVLERSQLVRLGRFIGAVRSLQLARLRVDSPLRVAGFGATLFGIELGLPASGAPYVLSDPDGAFYVAQPQAGRFGRVHPAVAEASLAQLAHAPVSKSVLSSLGLDAWSDSAAAALFGRLGILQPAVSSR